MRGDSPIGVLSLSFFFHSFRRSVKNIMLQMLTISSLSKALQDTLDHIIIA